MRPTIKGRIIQVLNERGAMWDYEIVELLMKEYNQISEIERGYDRIALIELASNGLLEVVDLAIDVKNIFGKSKLLYKYKLSEFGKMRGKKLGLI